jgi:hypothetical protein
MTDHRATPEQWANMADAASDGFDDGYGACIFELRARVEALESNSQSTPNDRQIRTSLIKRVHSCIVGEPPVGRMQARSVIREISQWLREREGGTRASWLLDNEVEQ